MDITNVRTIAAIKAIKNIPTSESVIFGNFTKSMNDKEVMLKIHSIAVSNIDANQTADITMRFYKDYNNYFYIANNETVAVHTHTFITNEDSFIYLPHGWCIKALSSRADSLDCMIIYDALESI